jgi:RNA polymerase sigma-70 factor (ECF subfamily)
MNIRPGSATDEELALEARGGSLPCFEELMARYGRRLGAFLGPKIASRQDVEDIVQETFLKLYRNIDRYDPRWKFSTWAYTAAGRLAISHYRAQTKVKKIEAAASASLTEASDKASGFSGGNLWETARALHPTQFQALWLFYAEDLSIREIARVMKKSLLAVRMLLHRGRLRLAELLGTTGDLETAASTGPRQGIIFSLKESSK